MKKTLVLIFAALTVMIGSFIWFVATWDASAEEPISAVPYPQPYPQPYASHTLAIHKPYGVS